MLTKPKVAEKIAETLGISIEEILECLRWIEKRPSLVVKPAARKGLGRGGGWTALYSLEDVGPLTEAVRLRRSGMPPHRIDDLVNRSTVASRVPRDILSEMTEYRFDRAVIDILNLAGPLDAATFQAKLNAICADRGNDIDLEVTKKKWVVALITAGWPSRLLHEEIERKAVQSLRGDEDLGDLKPNHASAFHHQLQREIREKTIRRELSRGLDTQVRELDPSWLHRSLREGEPLTMDESVCAEFEDRRSAVANDVWGVLSGDVQARKRLEERSSGWFRPDMVEQDGTLKTRPGHLVDYVLLRIDWLSQTHPDRYLDEVLNLRYFECASDECQRIEVRTRRQNGLLCRRCRRLPHAANTPLTAHRKRGRPRKA